MDADESRSPGPGPDLLQRGRQRIVSRGGIARGIYLPTDAGAADRDWLEATTRRSEATICLTSALAHHDLIDAVPARLDIAIPRGSRTPAGNPSIA